MVCVWSHLHVTGSVVMILVAVIWKEVRNLSMLCTCICSQMLSVCLSSCCCNHDIQRATRCLHCAQVCSMYTRCCSWSLHHPTDLCARYRSALTVQLFAGQVKILISISTKRGWRGSGWKWVQHICCKCVKDQSRIMFVLQILHNAYFKISWHVVLSSSSRFYTVLASVFHIYVKSVHAVLTLELHIKFKTWQRWLQDCTESWL